MTWPDQRILPYRLKPGATIGVCAPSGLVQEPGTLDMAQLYLEERGYRVIQAPHVRSRWEYFAGTDHERTQDFNALARNPDIHLILAARGGYGLTRIIQGLDLEALVHQRKIVVGFSDLTLLHLALLAQFGMVSFAGPMAVPDFGHAQRSAWHPFHFEGLLQQETHCSAPICLSHAPSDALLDSRLRAQIGQGIEGTLWGGNLSLVAHTIGTPFCPRVEEGILFLEEVNEEPYHIERMLMQLHHAGILQRQRALLLGQFNRCHPTAASATPYTLTRVVETLRGFLSIPVLQHLPFGHVLDKITLPVGGQVRITLSDEQHYQLTFSAYNAKTPL